MLLAIATPLSMAKVAVNIQSRESSTARTASHDQLPIPAMGYMLAPTGLMGWEGEDDEDLLLGAAPGVLAPAAAPLPVDNRLLGAPGRRIYMAHTDNGWPARSGSYGGGHTYGLTATLAGVYEGGLMGKAGPPHAHNVR